MFHFYTPENIKKPEAFGCFLLYPLKTSENRRLSDAFWGHRSGTLVEHRLSNLHLDMMKNIGFKSTIKERRGIGTKFLEPSA